jgi:Nif-specific regulatory protein
MDRPSNGASSSTIPPVSEVAKAKDPFAAICGTSHAIRDVVERLRLAAPLDIQMLFTGPCGTGKTLLATAVHHASARRDRNLVEINCATLQEGLLENELFGAEPGAHSAVPRGGLKGKVEAAEGGTLFLDEVAELSPGCQAKLLQLLQDKTYYRLGGNQLRRADVRVLAATNVDLRAAVQNRHFREDLYYRLRVLEVKIPSLAERSEDLVPLSRAFLIQALERHGLPPKALAPDAIRALHEAEWPGNVRELAHRIESAAIQAHLRRSDRIEDGDLFPEELATTGDAIYSLEEATRRFQRKHVLAVLQSENWNILEAARVLDVCRSHVYNLMRAFDLRNPMGRGSSRPPAGQPQLDDVAPSDPDPADVPRSGP